MSCEIWVHLALLKVCRHFYSEMIPLKSGKLSVHRESIHEDLVNLLLRCGIKYLLAYPQGRVLRHAPASGYE